MPVETKGPRLWWRRGGIGPDGKRRPGSWTVKDDGGIRVSTGVRSARGGKPPQAAQDALARYVLSKRELPREKHRSADAVQVADVIAIYMADVAPRHARPVETVQRCEALLSFWGTKRLSEVTGKACRSYAEFRAKPVARRELEDLRAAIRYHRAEGLCREVVEVTLPERSPPRERWLTRPEAARLIWAAWRYREAQKGEATKRRSRQHVARFILVALYTGTRAGAVCAASFRHIQGSGWIDLESGYFYRRASGERETKKRRPPVRLPQRLIGHMRRWRDKGQTYAVEWRGKRIATGVEKAFAKACADAGLEGVTPHTLRHSCATWLMQRGTSLWEAAGYLGMSVETLERVYGHHHADHQKQASENIVRKA